MARDVHPLLGAWLSTDGKKAYGLLLLDAEAKGKVECGVIVPRSLIRPPWAGKCGKRNRTAGWIFTCHSFELLRPNRRVLNIMPGVERTLILVAKIMQTRK